MTARELIDKATPGPWVDSDPTSPDLDILAEKHGDGNGWHEVARDIDTRHDAELIVRAVNSFGPMVEALEGFLDGSEESQSGSDDAALIDAYQEVFRQALAIANGEKA